jgi:hypothetical protein
MHLSDFFVFDGRTPVGFSGLDGFIESLVGFHRTTETGFSLIVVRFSLDIVGFHGYCLAFIVIGGFS